MEDISKNPYLQPEDYMAGYNESIQNLKNNPELISFEKLCYEVFNTDIGKKFMEYVKERYLIPAVIHREAPNYQLMVIWADGFKDFPRMLIQNVMSHEQRIKAETNK